ncbi:MAG: hypothetical protein SFV52_12825 [Saprospiraceae bacterium]|nr:hypothetical protein [Saprospiraceae bacterium]
MRWPFLLGAFITGMAACGPDERHLSGAWRAVAYHAADTVRPLPADTLRMIFNADGTYRYAGAAYYLETGRYRCSWRYLFLVDTLHDPPRTYTLRLERLEEDTLVLYMERDSVGERLIFVREE